MMMMVAFMCGPICKIRNTDNDFVRLATRYSFKLFYGQAYDL